MTLWALLQTSDAAIRLAGWCLIVGWLSGVGCVLCFGWRRLTTPTRAEECRRLQAQVDEAGAQVRALLDQNERLTKYLVLADRVGATARQLATELSKGAA
jgi:hypothetical protein